MRLDPTLTGLAQLVEEEKADESAVPSRAEVLHLWNLINGDLDRVNDIFSLVGRRLRKLRKWHHRGFVGSVRVDHVVEKDDLLWAWFEQVRRMVLDVGELDMPDLQDGAGI